MRRNDVGESQWCFADFIAATVVQAHGATSKPEAPVELTVRGSGISRGGEGIARMFLYNIHGRTVRR